ncbi:protein disulfide-isomerase A6 homolog [Chrysoperla carnea]|uniref:protein disulfide-isomerase A6 homolog n=1 Tax=Chrysoperla carnea TaxID=189513 RepID=UPI001D07994F|nr:protein disulfide-isomerase A6 homolog [Chrysoperla carnea]
MILKLDYNILKFVLFVCLCQRVHGLYPSSSEVVDLTAANFDRLVLQSDAVWVVEFYAPWCGHCQQLVPEYSKAATALKGVIKVGAINVDEHKSIGSKYGVQGFPTIKIFGADKSKPDEYQQDRTAKSIIDAAFSVARRKVNIQLSGGSSKKKSSDKNRGDDSYDKGSDNKDVIELTDKNFDELVMKSDDIWLVEFYAPWCGHCKNLAPIWAEAATELKGKIKVGALDATVHQQTAGRYQVSGYPTIKFFDKNDKSLVEDYTGGRRSASEIVNWAMDKYVNTLPPPEIHELIDEKVLNEVCDKDKIQLCIISILPDILDCQSECRNNYISTLKEIAGKFKTKLWGWLWNGALKQPHIEEAFEMGGFGYPAMVVVNFKKMKYSLFKGSFSKDGIYEFLRDLAFGRGANISPIKHSTIPKIDTIEPWDGLDGQLPEDDDIDLSDVVLDEKDEL